MSNIVSAVRARFEDLRSLAFGSISGSYAGVGVPFSNPVRILKVSNLTDANLLISFNGVDDKDVVPASSFCLYDFSSNQAKQAGFLEVASGDRVYVKEESAAATSGTVYVTVIYASHV